MTPEDRHSELSRLRAVWTEAVCQVALEAPGTHQWNQARLIERYRGSEYVAALTEPNQRLVSPGTATPRPPSKAARRLPAPDPRARN